MRDRRGVHRERQAIEGQSPSQRGQVELPVREAHRLRPLFGGLRTGFDQVSIRRDLAITGDLQLGTIDSAQEPRSRATDEQHMSVSATRSTVGEPVQQRLRGVARGVRVSAPTSVVLRDPLTDVAFDATADRLTATPPAASLPRWTGDCRGSGSGLGLAAGVGEWA